MRMCEGPRCVKPATVGPVCDAHFRQLKRMGEMKPLREYRRWPELQAYIFETARRFGRAGSPEEEAKIAPELMRACRVYGMRIAKKAVAV